MRPSFLDNMGWAMAEVYGAVTDRILVNLARYFPYIQDSGEICGSFEYQARLLAQMGQVNRETAQIIADSLEGADAELRQTLEAAIQEALKNEEPALRRAAKQGLLQGPGFLPPEVTPNQMQAFQAYYRQSADKLNLVNTVMLESTQEAYRATVSDITARIQRTQSILNTETGEVITGVTSWNSAMHDGVRKMVQNGLTGFIDHGGHHWSPEAYVAMDIRTTVFNTAREAVWERAEAYGCDLYQVSSHNGARPLCYPWQGLVISRNDQDGETTDLNGNRIRVYPQSATSYGQAAGLFGVNCKHYPMTFIPGFSTLKGQPQDPDENAEAYAQSQEQRRLERKLREEKRDLAVMKAQGADADAIQAQKARVSKASADIEDFCEQTGRARRRNREYTPVNADFSGAKTPPYGVPVANVTEEYRKKAKPGSGTVLFDTGYKNKDHDVEIGVADYLHNTYGGDIQLRKENAAKSTYTPDYTWNKKSWDQKTVSSAKAADAATRKGLKQIAENPGGLVFSYNSSETDKGDLVTVIVHRVKNNTHVSSLDIILIDQNGKASVYRMKK